MQSSGEEGAHPLGCLLAVGGAGVQTVEEQKFSSTKGATFRFFVRPGDVELPFPLSKVQPCESVLLLKLQHIQPPPRVMRRMQSCPSKPGTDTCFTLFYGYPCPPIPALIVNHSPSKEIVEAVQKKTKARLKAHTSPKRETWKNRHLSSFAARSALQVEVVI